MSVVDPAEVSTLPRDTTPTWEMELLVSGATTIGLLQLPPLLDRLYFAIANRGTENVASLVRLLWIYSKVALITLIVTFILHLCLRGYWVALVGMNSVYPGGVRWQNLRIGPISRALGETTTPPMAEAIELADNRATRVFGTGFGLAMLMLVPVLLALLGLGCSIPVDAALGPRAAITAFAIVIALVVLPYALSSVLDRRLGARLAAEAPLAKILRRVIEFYGRLGLGQRRNLLVNLFLSNQHSLRGRMSLLLILLPVFAIVVIPRSGGRGIVSLGSSTGSSVVAVFSERNATPAFYGNLETDRSTATPVPYISDRIARDPYLPLFVPFIPSRHLSAMHATCPAVVVQADHPEYRDLTPADLPGARAVLDGRGVLDAGAFTAAGVAVRRIGRPPGI